MAAVDPGALYTQTLADLGLTEGQELGKIGEAESALRTNVGFGESQITGQEPGTYKTEANRAAKGGIGRSGINAERKTTIANTFAGKRTANQNRLSQGLGSFNREREGVQLKKTEGEHTAGQQKAEREDVLRAQNPVVAPAQPAPLGVAPPAQGGVPQSPYGGPMTPAPGGGWQYRGPNGTWVRVGGTARRQ